MLFNSYIFLLEFLPISLLGYYFATKMSPTAAIAWLIICSLFFYGFWNPAFLILILGSVAFNYAMGRWIGNASTPRRKKSLFATAVSANVLLLVFFKYLGPLVQFFAQYGFISRLSQLDIILPLGISFFTFTQIGYLVDRRDGLAEDLGLLRYTLFVTFFPHLIAGPILHVREMGPQFSNLETFRLRSSTFAPGLAMFVIGLSKKVLLADPLGGWVALGFSYPHDLSQFTAWFTAVSYTIQLYFDFSGYSDMAIGLAGMFGMRFPTNFNSPYKSCGIIEFWQRWHMTLSRYLALLLYNPIALWVTRHRMARGLKVSRKALASGGAFVSMIAFPTFFTMALAGIWHGAGLQFLVFGLLHAGYLTINHAWRVFVVRHDAVSATPKIRRFSVIWQSALTFFAVIVAFVFFRAASCSDALALLARMAGKKGFGLSPDFLPMLERAGSLGRLIASHIVAPDIHHIVTENGLLRIALSLALIFVAPNSQQILGIFAPVLEPVPSGAPRWLEWRPSLVWAVVIAALLWTDMMSLRQSTVFLYFQF